MLLGVPIALQAALSIMLALVDRVMVGSLGEEAINAVAISGQILAIAGTIAGTTTAGIGVFAAQLIGARDEEGFARSAVNGFYAVLLGGVVTTAFILAGNRGLVGFMVPGEAATVDLAARYLTITMAGFTVMLAGALAVALLHAMGDTRRPMIVTIGQVALNTVLNAVLIFGMGPIPAMGVRGAAWATLISGVVGTIVLLFMFVGDLRAMHRSDARWDFRPDGTELKKIAAIGLPITLDGIAWQGAGIAYAAVLGRIGGDVLAAFMIAQSIRSLMFIPLVGLARGGAIAVGQDLGGRKSSRAQARTSVALRLGMASSVAMAIIVGVAAPQLAGLFDVDPETHRMAVLALRVIAALQLFETTNIILPYILRAGGDAKRVFAVTMTTFWAIGIPLAIVLGHGLEWGLHGVLLAMAAEFGIKSIILHVRFKSGRWRRRLVETD